jgi:hypothetical protein
VGSHLVNQGESCYE